MYADLFELMPSWPVFSLHFTLEYYEAFERGSRRTDSITYMTKRWLEGWQYSSEKPMRSDFGEIHRDIEVMALGNFPHLEQFKV